jgi:hypothetical protein
MFSFEFLRHWCYNDWLDNIRSTRTKIFHAFQFVQRKYHMDCCEIKFWTRVAVRRQSLTTWAIKNPPLKTVVFQCCRSKFGKHHLVTDVGLPAVRQHPCVASPTSLRHRLKFATSNQNIDLTGTLCEAATAIEKSTKQCQTWVFTKKELVSRNYLRKK